MTGKRSDSVLTRLEKGDDEKWFDLATKSLVRGDEEQYNWPARYDSKSGYVVLSKEKLLFVEEHGFIHTSASLLLDIPYDQINTIRAGARSQLEIITADGAKRSITTAYLSQIKNHLEQLISIDRQVYPFKIEVATAPAA